MFKNGGRKMKKVLLGIMFVMALFLMGCENPLDKMKETADAVEAAANLEKNIDSASGVVTKFENNQVLTVADGDVLIKTLKDIDTILSSSIANKVITEYATKVGVDLSGDITTKVLDKVENWEISHPQLENLTETQLTTIKNLAIAIGQKLPTT